jgi:putative effector of murein hydrolase
MKARRKALAKRIALGAGAGALAAVLMGVSYGAAKIATWDEVGRSMPQAIMIGIGMGAAATALGAPPLAAGLAVGTGLYFRNVVRALIAPNSEVA